MAASNNASLHDGIHNNDSPQHKSFDGYMSTSPYGMVPLVRVQAAIDDLGGIAVPEEEENSDNTITLIISSLINLEL